MPATSWTPGDAPPDPQTLHTVWFGDPQAAKRYTQYGLGTDSPPNVTHSMVWGPTGRQTLRPVWIGDLEAPKRYKRYDSGTQKKF